MITRLQELKKDESGVYSTVRRKGDQNPASTVSPEEIQSQLERIVSSRVFASSERMRRFLRFSIEETLAGRADELKETTIGLAVFDRNPDYDPRLDPIVRVEARRLREKLSQYYETDGREDPIIIELPRGHYAPKIHQRTQPAVTVTPEAAPEAPLFTPEAPIVATPEVPRVEWARRHPVLTVTTVILGAGLIAVGVALLVGKKAGAMRERDSIVLAEFANRTGDSVFDFTLRQALAAQLSQSPFLSIVPDERIRETLRVMGRSADDRLSHDVALEVCRRRSVKAMLTGSIAAIGRLYVLSLDATNCQTGEAIAREQRQVDSKEAVLRGLGRMASKMRSALGESLASIQRFDAPIEQITTPSLEALRAYTLGQRQRATGNEIQSIAFFLQAIELDPKFASAYNSLSNIYSNLGEAERAKEFAKLAFERRDHVSERERLYITYQYYDVVTGDQPRAIQALEVWKQSFPREFQPANSLAFIHSFLGDFKRAVEEGQEAIKRNPAHGFPYSNLAFAYRGLGRFEEARETAERAVSLNIETVPTRLLLYQLAVLAGDEEAAARHIEKARSSARELEALGARAQVAAWAGRVREARQLYEEAVRLAERRNRSEIATSYLARAAWMELVYGNGDRARTEARRVLARKPGYEPRAATALTLAATGSIAEAEAIAGELARSYPQHTIINSIQVPIVKAGVELARKRPERAVEQLRVAAPYDTGLAAALAPIYLRGQSYLMQRSGSRAAEEFQRILSHRGTDPFSPFHAVAPLGLARAFAMAGNIAGSLQAYQQFLAAWKSADPDVPVLLEARVEYERMKRGDH